MSSSVLAIIGLATLAVAWILGFVMPSIRVITYIIVGLGAAGLGAIVWDQVLANSRRGAEPTPGPTDEDIIFVLRIPFMED